MAETVISCNKKSINELLKKHTVINNIRKYPALYIMVLPGLVFFILFKYVPILGSVIAFEDYNIFKGIFESELVGLKHFIRFFNYQDFWRVVKNTVIIGSYKLLFGFPAPIILAVLINEVKNKYFKKTVQTIFYVPHFFSWVIIAGLTFTFLSLDGMVNQIIEYFGAEPVLFMQQKEMFRPLVVLTHLWRNTGWGTIVLMAALSSIDPQVYESAKIDGASRIRTIFSVTIPLLMPTVTVLFLLNLGRFLDLGFEHVYNLLTPMTYSVGDIIDTYVYRIGIIDGQYSFSTAIGMFQSIIGFIMVICANKLAKKYTDAGGLW